MSDLKNKIIDILRTSARLTDGQIAAMLDVTPEQVKEEIADLEDKGIIIGYSAIIDEEKFDKNSVTALIELKVSPQFEKGYSEIAGKVAQYREVESVRLMSGTYDLGVVVKGTNLRDVAAFVSDRLATMDGVISTATHFMLKQYKEKSELFSTESDDERRLVSP